MKKFILPVLLMGLAFSQSVFAAETARFSDVPSNASYAEVVNALADMGILNGDKEGRFNPDKTITRAEMATVICNLTDVSGEASQIKQSVFDDVPSNYWAVGYIAKVNQMGIISGYNKTTFGPKDPVTYEQFIKMLICASGHAEEAKKKGGWPDGYIAVANELGILHGVNIIDQKKPVPRCDVASIIYNLYCSD